MSTADHPQTDGQIERVNCVLDNFLRILCVDTPKRSGSMLSVVTFALNNSVHASTDFILSYVNSLMHFRVPLTLPRCGLGRGGGEVADHFADAITAAVKMQ